MKRQNEYEKNFLFNVCQLLFLSLFEEAFKSLSFREGMQCRNFKDKKGFIHTAI